MMGKRIAAKSDRTISKRLMASPLFNNMTEEDVYYCLECSNAECVTYSKGDMVFTESDMPRRLPIVLDGSVRVGRDSIDGKRNIIATFEDCGDIFGDVLLFLQKEEYGCFAQANSANTRVVFLPRDFMTHTCGNNCGHHQQLITNLLYIFARNAQSLNHRMEILTCSTLRQKIAKTLLIHCNGDLEIPLSMTREELAEYLCVTRPSISRELMRMQDEGLIDIRKRKIYVADLDELEDLM